MPVWCFWWKRVDSNHRSRRRQIYSLIPLATRELFHISGATQPLPLELVNGLSSQQQNSPPDCFSRFSLLTVATSGVSFLVHSAMELVNGLEPLTC